MPTGYTYSIEKGISFYEFVLRCARAMGACIEQREDRSDVLPKIQEPSDYNEKRVKEIEEEIDRFKSLSDSALEKQSDNAYEKDVEDKKERVRKKEALRVKYSDMLSKVKAWEPPTTEHYGLQSFMISQIEESIEWDCTTKYVDPPAKRISAKEYRKEKMERLLKDLSYNKEEYKKELERTEARNKWIRDLYENLEKYKNG